MAQWRSFNRRGQDRKADLIWKIAREPKALWLGRFTRPNFAVKVRRLIDPAKARGEVPIFTVLRAQATGCSPNYQGGGPREDAATRDWYDDLARVIGNDRVVIAFEPDSLGTIDCLARSRRDDRLRLLAHGVDVLSKNPNATIYIEAGAFRLGVGAPHGQAAARRRRLQGARLHAERDPLRLDGREHPARPRDLAPDGRQALHRQHRRERPRARPLQGEQRAPHHRLVQPGQARAGYAADTDTSRPDKVDAYLWINRPGFAQSCQGRPISWSCPGAVLRPLRHRLGAAAARRALRLPRAPSRSRPSFRSRVRIGASPRP